MKQSFAELTSITYQYVGKSEKTIASKKYLVSKYTIDNGTMYQEVYLRKIGDNVMMLMTVSYLSGKESIANEFIESIREP